MILVLFKKIIRLMVLEFLKRNGMALTKLNITMACCDPICASTVNNIKATGGCA